MATSDRNVAVVTGAGSGIGQAVALRLAKEGWRVALIGRRETALAETIALAACRTSDNLPHSTPGLDMMDNAFPRQAAKSALRAEKIRSLRDFAARSAALAACLSRRVRFRTGRRTGNERPDSKPDRLLAGESSPQLASFACDIGQAEAVDAMAAAVLARFGRVDALVNAAGMNIPRRSLAELARADYEHVVATNLHGAFYCTQAFLPGMRARGAGTIVNINSEAGRAASAKSGAAYVVSKFGLTGLTQAINAEERARGIRACSVFPGDVNTPLLDQRSSPPPADARAQMLQPDDVALCVSLVLNLPPRAIVEELVVRPR